MKIHTCFLLLIFTSCGFCADPPTTFVKAQRILDVSKGIYVENGGIWVEGEKIKEVGPGTALERRIPKNAQVIDLQSATVLPGLIDCHTHIMARLPGRSDEYDEYVLSLATKSQAFRALEGACNARITLNAGFTSIRDCESEGSGYADVALREAIAQGLVEGPRMQVATRGIAAVGQYLPFNVSADLRDFPTGAQMISGVEEGRRAVREQIGHGADFIKVYADWSHPTLTVEEIRIIVEEAHRQGLKVAAHATTPEAIRNAVTAGADSIEHGHGADRQSLELMKEKGTFLVPTVGVMDLNAGDQKGTPRPVPTLIREALDVGVKIASGFDPSDRNTHGRNANELIAMTERGMTPLQAIRCATLAAAELMGWQQRVGSIDPGKYADMVAVDGDPLTDISVLQQVRFVMKGGQVVKNTMPR